MGAHFSFQMFIFFRVEENEPKEDARAPLFPARRREDRRVSELASPKQADTLIPILSPMLGAGQRGPHPNLRRLFHFALRRKE
jgi:hypothetical protein